MTTRGLPPLFGAPWEQEEATTQSRQLVSKRMRDFWDINLENNPLRTHPDTDAGAFLAHMLEAAGDILREMAYPTPASDYIGEKMRRLRANLRARDWADPLSSSEQANLTQIVRLVGHLGNLAETEAERAIVMVINRIVRREPVDIGHGLDHLGQVSEVIARGL